MLTFPITQLDRTWIITIVIQRSNFGVNKVIFKVDRLENLFFLGVLPFPEFHSANVHVPLRLLLHAIFFLAYSFHLHGHDLEK